MQQVIARTNAKGQFVIPITMRKHWEITHTTPLQVIDIPNTGILIKPTLQQTNLSDEEFMDILDATKGSMAGADWDETEKKLARLAKAELKELKKNS